MLIAVWAGAAAGIVVELVWTESPKWVSVPSTSRVGWIGAIAFPAIVAEAGFGAGALIASAACSTPPARSSTRSSAPTRTRPSSATTRSSTCSSSPPPRRTSRRSRSTPGPRPPPIGSGRLGVRVGPGARRAGAAIGVLGDAFLDDPVWTAIGPRRRGPPRGSPTASPSPGSSPARRATAPGSGSPATGAGRRRDDRLRARHAGRCPTAPRLGARLALRRRPAAGVARDARRPRDARQHTELPPYVSVVHRRRPGPPRHRGRPGAARRAPRRRRRRSACPTYLETGDALNVSFYERDGYEVLGEIAMPSGPTMWRMERPGGWLQERAPRRCPPRWRRGSARPRAAVTPRRGAGGRGRSDGCDRARTRGSGGPRPRRSSTITRASTALSSASAAARPATAGKAFGRARRSRLGVDLLAPNRLGRLLASSRSPSARRTRRREVRGGSAGRLASSSWMTSRRRGAEPRRGARRSQVAVAGVSCEASRSRDDGSRSAGGFAAARGAEPRGEPSPPPGGELVQVALAGQFQATRASRGYPSAAGSDGAARREAPRSRLGCVDRHGLER